MSEQGDVHPADKMIGADWRPLRQVQMERAWENLDAATRERFTKLEGKHSWKQEFRLDRLEGEPEEKSWIEYELCPPDPRDETQPERIGRWPVKVEVDEDNRARAIVAEFESG